MKPRLLLLALLAAAATLVIGGGIVVAQSKAVPDADGYIPYVAKDNPMGWNMPYHFSQDDKDPSYTIARKAMSPTYKPKITPSYGNVIIGMAEVDLDRDKVTEIIAFPTEDFEQEGLFCNVEGLCPHYVIQIQGKKAAVLGILYGYKVNRGDTLKNGYLTLKVYTAPIKNPEYFQEYAYNPKTNEYEPVR